jgi:cytochrome c
MSGCQKKEEAPPAPASEAAPAPEAAAPATPMTQEAAPPSAPMAQEAAPPAAAPEAAAPAAAPTVADAESMMKKSDCFACHAVDKKLVGPAYSWVAFRFKGDKSAVDTLTAAVKNGSSGKWTAYTGGVPMPPHPQLSDQEIKVMVEWVLKQKPVAPPKA